MYLASTFDGPLGIAAGLHAAAALRASGELLPCGLATLGAFEGIDGTVAAGGRLALPPGPGLLGGCDPGPMSTEILRYAAFTERPEGGNPAGVVLDASGLDDAAMQAIAADVGYSETAFVTGEGTDSTCATSRRSPRCRSAGTRRSPPASPGASATGRACCA